MKNKNLDVPLLATRIDKIIKARGTTARAVSMAVNGRADTVRNILRKGGPGSAYSPELNTVIGIAKVLEVPLTDLLRAPEGEDALDDLIHDVRQCSTDVQSAAASRLSQFIAEHLTANAIVDTVERDLRLAFDRLADKLGKNRSAMRDVADSFLQALQAPTNDPVRQPSEHPLLHKSDDAEHRRELPTRAKTAGRKT